jgi:hypothetical protein
MLSFAKHLTMPSGNAGGRGRGWGYEIGWSDFRLLRLKEAHDHADQP